MKKILTLATMALMALTATLFSSCGDDKEEMYTLSLKYDSDTKNVSEASATVIANYFTILIGDRATVTRMGTDISISCTESNLASVEGSLKNMSHDDLTAALYQAGTMAYLGFHIYDDNNISIRNFYYILTPDQIFADSTWTANIGGVQYRIVFGQADEEGGTYQATAYIGSDVTGISGYAICSATEMDFRSTENGKLEIATPYQIGGGDYIYTSLQADVYYQDTKTTGVTFVKQI